MNREEVEEYLSQFYADIDEPDLVLEWLAEEHKERERLSGRVQVLEQHLKKETEGIDDVRDIVKTWLKKHGFDGLYCDECGCELDDLMPCFSDGALSCHPGYKTVGCDPDCGQGCKFHIGPKKTISPASVPARAWDDARRPATPQPERTGKECDEQA